MDTTIILILAAILVIREYQGWRDRKDLLDRIMCVDYQEYKKTGRTPAAQRVHVRMSDPQMAEAEKARRENNA